MVITIHDTCLLRLFCQRPQETFGGGITKWANFLYLKFWMLGRKTSLKFQSSRSVSACSPASAASMSSSNRCFISCWFVGRAYCNLRNEIKICNLRNRLEICNLRIRNVSFAKRKSLIVRKSSRVKADLFLNEFYTQEQHILRTHSCGLTKTISLSFFFLYHSIRSVLVTQHSEWLANKRITLQVLSDYCYNHNTRCKRYITQSSKYHKMENKSLPAYHFDELGNGEKKCKMYLIPTLHHLMTRHWRLNSRHIWLD